MKCYSELITLPTWEERFAYLRLPAQVGDITFGHMRQVNQAFYASKLWHDFRNSIVVRDGGNDMALEGYPIGLSIMARVHHIVPLKIESFEEQFGRLLDPENVILVSFDTHNAIHYGKADYKPWEPIERRPNDTIPWR